jgi:diacylglycerol kinase
MSREIFNLLLILVATGLVLITEIGNTAIEAICDFIEERHNEKIKMIKDIAAAAVGISIVVWFVVCAVEGWEMWSQLGKQ